MKNIYKKIKISPSFILIMLLALISGLFWDITFLFLIIIVHELGHIITSFYYKWNIKRIDITACGGYITYLENIDKPFKEEFLISVSGIFFQSLFYVFLTILYKFSIIDLKTILLIKKYHYSILIFNLIPIVPLDGSKILNIFLNIYFPYKKSLRITNAISVISIFSLTLLFISMDLKIEYGYIVILSFILPKIIKMIKDVPYLFNKFLFERYKDPIIKRKYNYINDGDINKMKRQKNNYFYIGNHYYKESVILSKRFDY